MALCHFTATSEQWKSHYHSWDATLFFDLKSERYKSAAERHTDEHSSRLTIVTEALTFSSIPKLMYLFIACHCSHRESKQHFEVKCLTFRLNSIMKNSRLLEVNLLHLFILFFLDWGWGVMESGRSHARMSVSRQTRSKAKPQCRIVCAIPALSLTNRKQQTNSHDQMSRLSHRHLHRGVIAKENHEPLPTNGR